MTIVAQATIPNDALLSWDAIQDVLQSQFDALEEPENALTIHISQTPGEIVAEILARIR